MLLSWQRFALGLRLILCGGPLVAVVFALGEVAQRSGQIMLGGGIVVIVLALTLPAVAVSATRRAVWLVAVPFWAVRIPWEEIESLEPTTVRPLEDHGGWGIKGSSRRRGLLFAASGTEAVRVERSDGRVYLATTDRADAVVAAARARMGTLER